MKSLLFEDTPEFWKALAERTVRNATPRRDRKAPRWVAVSDATAHGSGYSRDLCRYFGLDPDEVVKR